MSRAHFRALGQRASSMSIDPCVALPVWTGGFVLPSWALVAFRDGWCDQQGTYSGPGLGRHLAIIGVGHRLMDTQVRQA